MDMGTDESFLKIKNLLIMVKNSGAWLKQMLVGDKKHDFNKWCMAYNNLQHVAS